MQLGGMYCGRESDEGSIKLNSQTREKVEVLGFKK